VLGLLGAALMATTTPVIAAPFLLVLATQVDGSIAPADAAKTAAHSSHLAHVLHVRSHRP
jgi:hypothetical protein